MGAEAVVVSVAEAGVAAVVAVAAEATAAAGNSLAELTIQTGLPSWTAAPFYFSAGR